MSNFIKFLGTAGARIVVAKQLRASGGMWLSLNGTNLLIDPGPGCLVRCLSSRPKLDPTTLDGIVISHKHLDHSADINVMMEAMTLGGRKKKGVVLAPRDAIEGKDPVIYKYNRSYVDKIEVLKTGKDYKIGRIGIRAAIRHRHDVETYGLIIKSGRRGFSYITDTKFFPELAKAYKDGILIISVLRYNPTPYDHLCVREAKEIIREIKPKTTILTHFGMEMIKAKPWKIAEDLTKELKTKVIAASDGMEFKF